MAFNNSFTAVTGATYTAAQYNTHTRDNLTAIWVYTTAGDIAYATSATALARLGIGANGTYLSSNGSAPSWQAKAAISGLLHTKGFVTVAPAQTLTGSTWTDITGATFDLTLTQTCTILVLAVVEGYQQDDGKYFYCRADVNGTPDPNSNLPRILSGILGDALSYIYYATGVTAGTRTVKLQGNGDGGASGNVYARATLRALAFVE